MINEFKNLTKKELEYIKTHPVTVYEQLDLPYFKCCLNQSGYTVLTSKNKEITEIDCVINDMYKNVVDFVKSNILNHKDKIIDLFGDIRLGFFYNANTVMNTIEYPYIKCSFILNDFYTLDKNKKDEDKLMEVLGDVFEYFPYICVLPQLPDVDPLGDSVHNVGIITKNKTWSGNDILNIEGIILSYRYGKSKCKIKIKETVNNIDVSVPKLYRKCVIEDFVNVVTDDVLDNIVAEYDGYIERMSYLFLEYMNMTDLLNKTYIEKDDLLPPKNGYIGDLDFSSLPSTVSLVCKGNDVFKNILRVLLVAFRNDVKKDLFLDFSVDLREKIERIFSKINN